MNTYLYNFYATRWASIKPIRGRAVDIRPLRKRTKQSEQIVRNVADDGVVSYACRLYSTDCVEYYPDGTITIRAGNWNTSSTASFIHTNSPFTCFKTEKKLWLTYGAEPTQIRYPLGPEGLKLQCLTVLPNDRAPTMRDFVAIDAQPLRKAVIDRAKANEARLPMRPFLKWAKAFLTMSDGWIMHSTRKEVISWVNAAAPRAGFSYIMSDPDYTVSHRVLAEPVYADLCRAPEENYLMWLCEFLRQDGYYRNGHDGRMVLAETTDHWPRRYYDIQFTYAELQSKVYKLVASAVDITKIVEVQASGKVQTNIC